MVKVYTWDPMNPSASIENDVAPDLGHCSLAVVDAARHPSFYASYWPDMDCVAGRLTDLVKHRPYRHPNSYAEEVEAEGHFMQRPADHVETLCGLDEDVIARRWVEQSESRYHLQEWNCCSLCRDLLLASMDPGLRDRTAAFADGADERATSLAYEIVASLRDLGAPTTLCCPDDILRLCKAYNSAFDCASSEATV